MRIFGIEIRRIKNLSSVPGNGDGGWFPLIRESFGGAWQSNISVDSPQNILAFSAVYACVTVIANDIGKLPVRLMQMDGKGISTPVKTSPYLELLRKPNHYQNRIKFIESWIVSKLLNGNTYVLKKRNVKGIVESLYILDPSTRPMIASNGDVYYEVKKNDISRVEDSVMIPATEIIHDRMTCLWHPLVGVSPIFACGITATMGNKIQANSTNFFSNQATPSGILTAPGSIDDETSARLKETWDDKYRNGNYGKIAVLGSGLTYQQMAMTSIDAQLIEQLKWTVEDVARCFHTPLYKIGGPIPSGNNVEALNQTYYSDCLQSLIENLEISLDDGLKIRKTQKTEMNLDNLLRMDQTSLVKSEAEAVKAGIKKIDEARARLNLASVEGGDTPYLQQQNYSLAALAKRDAKEDPFSTAAPPPDDTPKPDDEEETVVDKVTALVERTESAIAYLLDTVNAARKVQEEKAQSDLMVQSVVNGIANLT